MRTLPLVSVAASAVATLLVTGNALAQQAQAQGQAAVGGQAQAAGGVALPGQAAAVAPDSDHDAMVGRLAVGYLGRRTMGLGAAIIDPTTGEAQPAATADAPVVGIRYWMDPAIGLDVGLGFGFESASSEVEVGGISTDYDHLSPVAFIVHAGVPLSLTSDGHFSFQIVPELNVGYATQSFQDVDGAGNARETTDTGMHLDVGARAGAEVHFGFMGLPQLSLQGSVGLSLEFERVATEIDVTTVGITTTSWNGIRIGTDVYESPWYIFHSNVAALYYF